MDIQMPGMDGYMATRIIRDPNSTVLDHRIPIVAMTANAMKGDMERCLEAGMDDYVAKPVDTSKLVSVLSRWLSQGEPGSSGGHADNGVSEKGSDDVFDQNDLLVRMMNDASLAKVVVEAFIEDMPLKFKAIEEALAKSDIAAVTRLAHTMKGAAANVSGWAMSNMAGRIEFFCENEDLHAVHKELPNLEESFRCLRDVLSASAFYNQNS
jgi:HPt (histidine-containing phosphotransfer) domain-containing protein